MGSKYLFKVRYGAAAFAIGAGMLLGAVDASANAKGEEEVAPAPKEEVAPAPKEAEAASVVIDGGTVTSETVIDISVDGGTAISDASGGDDNFAFDAADAAAGEDDDEGRGGVLGLRDELVGGGDDAGAAGDVAAAGNGGTADASANGGAVSVGDINSGGNAGNTIEVGNTGAPVEEKKPEAPKPVAPKPEAPKTVAPKPEGGKKVVVETGNRRAPAADAAPRARGGDRARDVASLPSTGIGPMVEGETNADALLLVAGAIAVAGAAGVATRKRLA